MSIPNLFCISSVADVDLLPTLLNKACSLDKADLSSFLWENPLFSNWLKAMSSLPIKLSVWEAHLKWLGNMKGDGDLESFSSSDSGGTYFFTVRNWYFFCFVCFFLGIRLVAAPRLPAFLSEMFKGLHKIRSVVGHGVNNFVTDVEFKHNLVYHFWNGLVVMNS